MKKTNTSFLDLSVLIPMRNSSSTILETLRGIQKQTYPIKEIIVIDNASTDGSVFIVEKYAKEHKSMHIKLIKNEKDLFIARSYVKGVSHIKSDYIVFIQSDCRLVGTNEFDKLVKPFQEDSSIVATYGLTHQPLDIWKKYAFWEQFLFSYQAGKTCTGLLGKIDCVKRDAYIKAGGHDEVMCDNYGGEDADLHMKLLKIGKTVGTDATIEHLHYIYNDFSFQKLLVKKKIIAGAYGVLLKRYGLKNDTFGIFTMLLKPALAIGLIIPQTRIISLVIIVLFIILYYRRMFITSSVVTDPRIVLVPFAFVFLLYLETFWTIKAFLRT